MGRFPSTRSCAEGKAIAATVEALLSSRKALIVCGGSVVLCGAENELAALARNLDLPVATTVSGQGAIAETYPLALGVVGSNGVLLKPVPWLMRQIWFSI